MTRSHRNTPNSVEVRTGYSSVVCEERWADSPFAGYQVSTRGRVIGPYRKLLSVGRQRDGRPAVKLQAGHVNKRYGIHVLILLTFVGPRPNGHHAAHRDDDRLNNCLCNLYWATPRQNRGDMIRNGKPGGPAPERSATAKLDWGKVREIRRLWATGGFLQKELAEMFSVGRPQMSGIIRNLHWRE